MSNKANNRGTEFRNLCTVVRNAVEALGVSTVKVVSVIQSAIGEMKHTGTREGKMGDMRYTETTKGVKASTSFKPGAETFEYTGPNLALKFKSFHDLIAKAEAKCPTMTITIEPKGEFGQWLVSLKESKTAAKKAAKAAKQANTPAVTTPVTPSVTPAVVTAP